MTMTLGTRRIGQTQDIRTHRGALALVLFGISAGPTDNESFTIMLRMRAFTPVYIEMEQRASWLALVLRHR